MSKHLISLTFMLATIWSARSATTNQASPITNILGSLVNNIACRATTNYGRTGQCLPRSCCSLELSVERLCIDGQHTCCYGQDLCLNNQDYHHSRPGEHHHHHEDDFHRDRPPFTSETRPSLANDRPSLANDRFGPSCNNFIHRREWNARETFEKPIRFRQPLNAVVVHHTDDGGPCFDHRACLERVYEMQSYYQRRKNFPDIPWNFLIADNGDVIEGMGWHYEGYHTENWNYRSLGVAFIGDFDERLPSRRALETFDLLLECGVRYGHIDGYFGIYGHRDMKNTDCPGDELYDYLRGLRSFRGYSSPKSSNLVSKSAVSNVTEVVDSKEKL